MAKPTLSFKRFLRNRTESDDPEGDFVDDALSDKKFPSVTNLPQLERYLMNRHACPEAIEAARKVWAEYVR